MNYYIQGSSARAKEIKAAFEAKGCTLYRLISQCDSEDLIYYSLNGRVRCIKKDNLYLFEAHPGYTKLELPVEPKFKVGDDIKTGNTIETIAEVGHATRSYYCESGRTIYFENQDLWHLVPKPHYDIANFKPFDKVLVRCSNDEEWMIEFYCKYDTLVHTSPHRDYPFMGIGDSYSQCIPFEGNEHLLGTTDPCDEMYINW